MLKQIEGVEIKCEYNCFEKDKSILKEIEDLYNYLIKKDIKFIDVDFDFISNALRILNKTIVFELLRKNYQGDAYILFRTNNEFILYQTSYGSCSYCDIWTDCDFVKTMYEEARHAIKFPNVYETIKYLLCADFYEYEIREFGIKWAKKIINSVYNNNQIEQIKKCLIEASGTCKVY